MNRYLLEKTVRAVVEDLRPQELLPPELTQKQESWMQAKVVQGLEIRESLEKANRELEPDQIDELAIEEFRQALVEELRAPVPPV